MSNENQKNSISRLKKIYLEPGFLISALVLGIAGIAMSWTMDYVDAVFQKEPLPLKKPLSIIEKTEIQGYNRTKENRGNIQ